MPVATNATPPAASTPAAPLPNAAMLVHGAILDMLARNKAEPERVRPLATRHGESQERRPQFTHSNVSD